MQKNWATNSLFFVPLVGGGLAGANIKTNRANALNITQKEGVVY